MFTIGANVWLLPHTAALIDASAPRRASIITTTPVCRVPPNDVHKSFSHVAAALTQACSGKGCVAYEKCWLMYQKR